MDKKKTVEKKKTKKLPNFELIKPHLLSPDNTMGLGSCVIGQGFVTGRFSIERIEKIIRYLKEFNPGIESFDIAWAKGYPVIIGKRDGNKLTGFILAPVKISDDDE